MELRKPVMCAYFIAIFLYALVYYYMGYENFTGMKKKSYIDCLYFSSTTMSTCGYGDILPVTNKSKWLVISQQLITILFAVVILFPDEF